jgi:pimeloyl-ACP methyl ester carboxylesterase
MPPSHQPGKVGAWANAGAEQEFRRIEDELRAELWPGGLHDITVDGEHGTTHLYHRPGTGPPLVLLPGRGAPGLMWRPELVAQLGTRPVYLVDTIGDVGRSVQKVAIDEPAALVRWLDDVLAALDVGPVDLAGASYGGWVVLNQAVRSPERLRSIALVEPVGLAELSKRRFLLWGIACGLAAMAPDPLRRRAAVRLRQGALTDARARRIGRMAYTKHRFNLPRPGVVTDDQLRSVTLPALVLLAERSEVHDPVLAQKRAMSYLADVEVELVPGAGHSLPVDQAEQVGRRLAAFLAP